jgi:monoamine oxidase
VLRNNAKSKIELKPTFDIVVSPDVVRHLSTISPQQQQDANNSSSYVKVKAGRVRQQYRQSASRQTMLSSSLSDEQQYSLVSSATDHDECSQENFRKNSRNRPRNTTANNTFDQQQQLLNSASNKSKKICDSKEFKVRRQSCRPKKRQNFQKIELDSLLEDGDLSQRRSLSDIDDVISDDTTPQQQQEINRQQQKLKKKLIGGSDRPWSSSMLGRSLSESLPQRHENELSKFRLAKNLNKKVTSELRKPSKR